MTRHYRACLMSQTNFNTILNCNTKCTIAIYIKFSILFSSGVWICPLRLRAAQKDAKSKTAFARMLLMFFYKKEQLKGKRLHELDQDIVHAVAGWYILQTSISGLSLRAGGPGDQGAGVSPSYFEVHHWLL